MNRLWLDSAATTPLAPEVAEAMAPWMRQGEGGNPSSLHAEGRAAKRALEDARERLASLFDVPHSQVHFTGSATEANNLALAGHLRALPRSGRPHRVIASTLEHGSVMETLHLLEREEVARVTWIPGTQEGVVDLSKAESAFAEGATLASLMHVNNETGIIQPVSEWAKLARETTPDITLHCDAVQAIPRLGFHPVDADLLVVSAHKVHGPVGIGALIRRRPTPIMPLIVGGPQEGGLRAGTEPLAQIIGLVKAMELAAQRQETTVEHLGELSQAFLAHLTKGGADLSVHGRPETRAPGILSLHFPHFEATDLIIAADLEGLALSAGSACHSGTPAPSHVLSAMGLNAQTIRHTVRVAFHRDQTHTDALEAAERLLRVLRRTP